MPLLPVLTPAAPRPVEVFRTSIRTGRQANVVLAMFQAYFPELRTTIDLHDCDRILRVQRRHDARPLPVEAIRRLVLALGFEIDVLEE